MEGKDQGSHTSIAKAAGGKDREYRGAVPEGGRRGDTRGQSGNSRDGSDTKGGDNGVMVSCSEVTEGSEVYQVPRGC